jgi:hypothetical protein
MILSAIRKRWSGRGHLGVSLLACGVSAVSMRALSPGAAARR